jgi:hypothetical protein
MKRDNRFIFQWVAWLCIVLAACSDIEDEWESAIKVNENSSDTRTDFIEYTINVETAGSLGSIVEAGNYSNAKKLTITGKITYEDVNYVDVNMKNVEILDLSGSTYSTPSLWDSFLSSDSSIKEISLPGNIISLGGTGNLGPFYKCNSLTSVTLPESVRTLGDYAFWGCSFLSNISIPQSVTSIGDYAFLDCNSITSITLPDGVKHIGRGAFDRCRSLTCINIPKGVKEINSDVFSGCSSLNSITIPEGVTSIGGYAFLNCSSLNSIIIPEGVTSLGNLAFYGCSSLTSFNIPRSVTSIGERAFYGCNSIKIIKWNTSCSLTDYINDLVDKLILYAAEDITPSEGSNDNVITVKTATYTKTFSSAYGNSWYTISLPFKPAEITHEEKGTIAPFDSDIEGAKNFWLRELTSDGYQDVTEMEANHAYIIAMPTSKSLYAEEFRLDGNVTFSAENVTIDWKSVVSKGPTYTMYPTYEMVEKAMDVYAMNSEYWVEGYDYGHAFVRGAMDVAPFQAYVKLNDGVVTMRSVLPMADGKITTLRGASSSGNVVSRGVYGQRKPQIDDM